MERRERWIDPDGTLSVSDLAEYAYCPRALYYRLNPPTTGSDPAGELRAERGSRFHAQHLNRVYRRESTARSWGLLLAVSALALAALAALWVVGWT